MLKMWWNCLKNVLKMWKIAKNCKNKIRNVTSFNKYEIAKKKVKKCLKLRLKCKKCIKNVIKKLLKYLKMLKIYTSKYVNNF